MAHGLRSILYTLAILIVSLNSATAVEILKKEPADGAMRAGTPVYVESKTCPKGQVLRVLAGTSHRTFSTPRIRECVPTPQ